MEWERADGESEEMEGDKNMNMKMKHGLRREQSLSTGALTPVPLMRKAWATRRQAQVVRMRCSHKVRAVIGGQGKRGATSSIGPCPGRDRPTSVPLSFEACSLGLKA